MKTASLNFFDRPWALHPSKLSDIAAFLDSRERDAETEWLARNDRESQGKPAFEIKDGVAIIPVNGVIERRMNIFMRFSGGTSTELLKRDIGAALDNPSVKAILLDVDSPGGSVHGPAQVCDFIHANRGKVPIVAVANEMIASAAYWIASAADKIVTSTTAIVGSIGVVASVLDRTAANEKRGLRFHTIKSGKFKALGNPNESLTEEGREVLQAEVDEFYSLFVEAVARNRGVAVEDVLPSADGRVFVGRKAIEAGLADEIGTFGSVLDSLKTRDVVLF